MDQGVTSESDELLVVFFGAMGLTNDLGPVLEAARLVSRRKLPIKFVICGRGRHGPEVSELAGELDSLVAGVDQSLSDQLTSFSRGRRICSIYPVEELSFQYSE
jgi:hypothetical protein